MTLDDSVATPVSRSATRPLPLARPYSRVTVWLVTGVLGKADAVGYAICHRIPGRSFHVHGRSLPLCARCTGIYLGVMAGLALYAGSGRIRASRLPPVRILAVLFCFGAAIAADGLNSYLSLFAAYHPIYPPSNTLRLITGMYAGITLITVVLPVFNMTVWQRPYHAAPLDTLKELAALCLVAALVIAAVLIQQSGLLLAFGLVSTAGVVLVFGMVGITAFLTITRRENSVMGWRSLLVPSLAGLAFAAGIVGLIDLARYLLTGTWEGFTILG
jgi:uncharacterized membrane protein